MNRSPELDFVLARFESPKQRLPPKLPSKPNHDPAAEYRGEEEEEEEEGTWDRTFVKSQSLKSLRLEKAKNRKDTKGRGDE